MRFLKNILGAFVEFKEEDKSGQPAKRQDDKDKNKYYNDKYRIIGNVFVEFSPAKGLTLRMQR